MISDQTFWAACSAVVSALAVGVAFFQLRALKEQIEDFRKQGKHQTDLLKEENVKQRTLDVCMKYDTDPTIADSCRRLREARDSGAIDQNLQAYRFDIVNLLNYLDLIAIGINEGLYSEKIARDHMEPIVALEYEFYLTSGRVVRSAKGGEIKLEHYEHLTSLYDRWKKPSPAPVTHHKEVSS